MIKIKLRDEIREFDSGVTALDIAKGISDGLARVALAAKINGKVKGLDEQINEDAEVDILTFDSNDGCAALRHSASHLLAQAVKRLFPKARLAIGPATADGFYYDFDTDEPFVNEDLASIENEMKKIAKEALQIERFELGRREALDLLSELEEPYKIELVNDLSEDETISFYRQGDFMDLCAGPHVPDTSYIKAFKLLSVTGAYWRGSEKNKMLRRIYGTAFFKKSDLTAYLEMLEEAKKRDHNKIGREMGIFTTSELIGQGLPILLPKGAKVVQTLQRFVEDTEEANGWQLTKTPFMAKSDIYKLSGHWDHYRDGMFIMGDEDSGKEVFALRPMTCPFQYQAYLSKMRSYRDLPLRYNETSTLFRNEASGEMHGLIRVRQFTISEGHLMCRPDQLEEEFRKCLEMAVYMLKTLGLYEDVSYRFSKWDPQDTEKYIGTPEQWDEAEGVMEKILNHIGMPYKVGIGEAAFYGPKLDIQIKNVFGKEDTLITIQVDQMLAEKFGMEYVDADGTKKNPYIIHRTSIGCYERTLALLIEKYAGAFPTWLAPIQAIILPISEKYAEYSESVAKKFRQDGIRVSVDSRSEKIGYKIREAQLDKIPYMIICGEKEEQDGTVSIRSRKDGDMGAKTAPEATGIILDDIKNKSI